MTEEQRALLEKLKDDVTELLSDYSFESHYRPNTLEVEYEYADKFYNKLTETRTTLRKVLQEGGSK